MRALLQRVSRASVAIHGELHGEIGRGLLVLLGIGHQDSAKESERLIHKLIHLRIFADEQGRMNRSVSDVGGEILVVSQFTLYAESEKGNRPSYTAAAPPEVAVPLYENFLRSLREAFAGKVAEGVFGADMQVSLVNDGPVTIWLEASPRNG